MLFFVCDFLDFLLFLIYILKMSMLPRPPRLVEFLIHGVRLWPRAIQPSLGQSQLNTYAATATHKCCIFNNNLFYFLHVLVLFTICFLKTPEFLIIPEIDFHPGTLCNVHDRELQLYVSQFFISEEEPLKVDLDYHSSQASNFEHIW